MLLLRSGFSSQVPDRFRPAGATSVHSAAARPDETLLYVTGFDRETNSFEYTVNERFGATGARANAVRAPFQIGIQVRATFGPDRARDALNRMRGGGGGRGMGGFGGGVMPGGPPGMGGMGGMGPGVLGSPEEFLARWETLFPNPGAVVLEMRDTLILTEDQIVAVTALRDTLTVRNRELAEGLRGELEGAGEDLRALMTLIRPALQEARENVVANLRALREILIPTQWEQLPEEIRSFESPQQPGVRRRPGEPPIEGSTP